MGILQIKYHKNRIVSRIILALNNWISHAGFLYLHIVFKDSLTVKTQPRIGGIRNRYLYFRVGLHVLVYFLLIIGAEPQLSILFKTEHERTALCLSIPSHGSQILHRVCL